MYREKVAVWWEFWSAGAIGLNFFENDMGQAIADNGENCRLRISKFFQLDLMIGTLKTCNGTWLSIVEVM